VSPFVFPDNTVLCNFAAVERLDLLEAVFVGHGRWTEAVADEARRSTAYLPALAVLTRENWLGEPIEIDDEEDVARIERIRRAVFGGKEERPRQHLGEAQTCYLIKNRPEFAGSHWVSDDKDALRYARRQGLVTLETVDLVRQLVADEQLTLTDGFTLLSDMRANHRKLRFPASAAELERIPTVSRPE
jgi:predicted nucleic acid-binding protein